MCDVIACHPGESSNQEAAEIDSEFSGESPCDDRVATSLMSSSEAISPVLMIWLTLLCMYLVNSAADHLAVCNRAEKGADEVSIVFL